MTGSRAVREVIRRGLRTDVVPDVTRFAQRLSARHGSGALAVLFYGSCLRSGGLDGLLDFYLVVDSYRDAYSSRRLALANRLLPPNVFYLQDDASGRTLRAKYAVISLAQLRRLVGASVLQSYFWARFGQPMRLVWCRDPAVETALIETLAVAAATLYRSAPAQATTLERWRVALSLSYGAELRPEGAAVAARLVQADRAYFTRLGEALERGDGVVAGRGSAAVAWLMRRCWGKTLNVARVIKAYWTFAGGVDYLFWKIGRHSGVTVEVTDAMRRHPWRRALPKLWRLYRQGAFR